MQKLRELIKEPDHWRSRAKEMWSTAEKATDQKAKVAMKGAADAYDNIAREVESKAISRERQERDLTSRSARQRSATGPKKAGQIRDAKKRRIIAMAELSDRSLSFP
jgi:hypothetical protein